MASSQALLTKKVYPLPSELTLPQKTIDQCRWSAYNSELLLYQHLISPTSPIYSTYTTTDPYEADLFFIPLFPASYLFECWVAAGWKKTERCSVDSAYIQPVMNFIQNQQFWQKSNGADHFLFHPMDYADGYYTEQSRLAMNASIYLVTVGDNRPPPYSKHFRHYQDLVIPSSTHLLNSYFVNPMDYLNEAGQPLLNPRGAGDPNKPNQPQSTQAEIFRTSDKTVKGKVWDKFSLGRSKPLATVNRSTIAMFRGGVGNAGEGETYALGIRSLFFPSTGNASLPPFSTQPHAGFSSLPGYDISQTSENQAYALALARSKYGLAPPGYTLDTTRIYEYLAFGVVPVFIGSGPIAGQVLPFQHDLDWTRFTISIPRHEAHKLPEILASISEQEYEAKRRAVWELGRLVVLEARNGNAWKFLIRDFCRMRRIGTQAGPEIANN